MKCTINKLNTQTYSQQIWASVYAWLFSIEWNFVTDQLNVWSNIVILYILIIVINMGLTQSACSIHKVGYANRWRKSLTPPVV